MKFELLVAIRYLKAKRRQAVISIITLIAIAGVAAGVAALVIAMAVSAGLRQDMQERLLGAQAHITVLSSGPAGISNYLNVAEQVQQIEGVLAAAPYAYQGMMLSHKGASDGVLLKGVIPSLESKVSSMAERTKEGDFSALEGNAIAVGKELADAMLIGLGDEVTIVSGRVSPNLFGTANVTAPAKVVAIFSLGLYEYDTRLVFMPLDRAQYLIGTAAADVASGIDVKVKDIDSAAQVGARILEKLGPDYMFEDWKERNKTLFQALQLERLGMTVAIGLIVLVAALNIVATLIMMVLEKTRDIATLMAMGANRSQIRRIFILQGVVIGVIGTAFGLIGGLALSYAADTYRRIEMAPEIYGIEYLPFRPDVWDSIVVALSAIAISFL